MSVRICLPAFDGIYKYENGGGHGVAAATLNLMLSLYVGLNVTIIPETLNGAVVDADSLTYDGCIGSMQKNQSDSVIMPIFTIPVMGPNLTHTIVDGSEKMVIFSCYLKPDGRNAEFTHVLDMVTGFEMDLWMVVILYFTLLLMMLAVAFKIMQRKDNLSFTSSRNNETEANSGDEPEPQNLIKLAIKFYHKRKKKRQRRQNIGNSVLATIACILNQNSCCAFCEVDFPPVSILYTIITLLSFFTCFYLTSMIKTDMVVMNPPYTVNNYQEIIDSGRRPAFVKFMNADYAEFESAAPGSDAKKIHDVVMSMGVNESLIDAEPSELIRHGYRVCGLQEVIIMRMKLAEPIIYKTACQFSRTQGVFSDKNGRMAWDPSAQELLRGDVQNYLLAKPISRMIAMRKQKNFEGDLVSASSRIMGQFIPMENVEKYYTSITECSTNVIVMPHMEMQAVTLFHYFSLFSLTGLLITLSLIILSCELRSVEKVSSNHQEPVRTVLSLEKRLASRMRWQLVRRHMRDIILEDRFNQII